MVIQPESVAALAALLDDGLAAPGPGDILPPMWHWVALARWPRSSELATDGHPERDSFVPPPDLPRRMFAGGEVRFRGELRVGETVRRESELESVTEKTGRSGRLLLLVNRIRLFGADGELRVDERRDIIYRSAAAAPDPAAPDPAAAEPTAHSPAAPDPVPADPAATDAPGSDPHAPDATAAPLAGPPLRRTGDWCWDFATDPTLLMRFSAATANPHRIHYDWPYVTQIEGYPGLVVHGPLMTLALAEVLRLECGERCENRVDWVRHRNKAPLFCGQPARVEGRQGQEQISLDLAGPAGTCTSMVVARDRG